MKQLFSRGYPEHLITELSEMASGIVVGTADTAVWGTDGSSRARFLQKKRTGV